MLEDEISPSLAVVTDDEMSNRALSSCLQPPNHYLSDQNAYKEASLNNGIGSIHITNEVCLRRISFAVSIP